MENAFGRSSPWSVGIEEEVMILDAGSLEQVPAVEILIRDSHGLALPGELKRELFASVVELATGICSSVEEVLGAVRDLRRAAGELGREHGLALAAAGTHPLSDPERQEIADDERYRRFVDYAGASARRQGVNGLHVHIGMPSPDVCFHALEGVLPWLPLVLALSANSPYLAGRETGLASTRAEVLAQLPRSGAPPAFRSYEDWVAWVDRLGASGLPLAADYTSLWWDVRPHPRLGTLELRMADQPTDVRRTGALSALLQALCLTAVREEPPPYEPSARGIYAQNRWAALRFGVEAELIHPSTGRATPATTLAHELLERVQPAAEELGAWTVLGGLGVTRPEWRLQLEVGRREGLQALCADLVERSLV